jgi:hypothetical protein
MRQMQSRVDVQLRNGRITVLQLEGRSITVHGVVNAWCVGGRWWRLEAPRTYYWLQTDEGLFEVFESLFSFSLSGVQD